MSIFDFDGTVAKLAKLDRESAMKEYMRMSEQIELEAAETSSPFEEATSKLSELKARLEQLGAPRPTAAEQRRYLLKITEDFQTIVRSALAGDYHHPLFSARSRSFPKRLRSVMNNHNIKFYKLMAVEGQKRLVVDVDTQISQPFLRTELVPKEEFLDHVRKVIRKNRGLELQVPGTCNLSAVVSELFREQSEAWGTLAHAQVQSTWKAACKFLSLVINHVFGQDNPAAEAVKKNLFDPAMAGVLRDMDGRCAKLVEGNNNAHPITFSPEFSGRMEDRRLERLGRSGDPEKLVRETFHIAPDVNLSHTHEMPAATYDLKSLVDALKVLTEQHSEQAAVLEAFDALNVYYDIAIQRFIDNMAIQVVEELLLAKLPDLLSTLVVDSLDAEKLEQLVGEDKVKEYREKLMKEIQEKQAQLKSLQREEGPISNAFEDDDDDEFESVDTGLDQQMEIIQALRSTAVPGPRALSKGQSGGEGGDDKKEEHVVVLEPEGKQQQMESAPDNKPAGGSGTGKAESVSVASGMGGGKKGRKNRKN